MCFHAKWCEVVIGALVLVFALWQTQMSQWILVALGIILIIHAFVCTMCCNCCDQCQMPAEKKAAGKAKKRR